ncbi:(+)-neomenthol dehydrogenase-like [Gossypium australe]|uniref:(+)-neomenthol dehydrogenase-like n=1 Tax=Gossypium australe TaxID=47621 RepID=A0A5B6VSI3_9ROSI|nr:(+)-neomenthol dehydrogenase-like [Gossypium australe]
MQSLMIPKGCIDGHPKMFIVGCNSISQPRAWGGLGFRHLEDQNHSFLMKIGFSLVSKSNALWVRVLRAKYSWKDQFPYSISRNQCSHLWRALSKI